MKTRRSSKFLATVAAASLVFAACGGDDDDDAGDDAVAGDDADDGDSTGDDGDDGDSTGDDGDDGDSTGDDGDDGDDGDSTGDDGDDGDDMAASGGTLVWAHEQEPPDMHLDDPNNNLSVTSWIRSALIEGLYGISGGNDYYPELLAEDNGPVDNGDGSVTVNYVLRDGLTWSDGDDLTADDVKWTFDSIMAADGETEDGDPNYIYLLGDRTGLDTITSFEVTSPTEFSVTWSAFFAGWKGVMNEVYPMHVFPADPVEAATALNESLPQWNVGGTVMPSSGPMIFDSWEVGVQMNLVRNDNYSGSNSPDAQNTGVASVDGVQINFVTDTDAQINALLAGEAQIVMTQPQLAFEQLSSSDDFTVASSAGPVFEHWGLNVFNAHLADPLVREALAFAMDKSEVMAGLYTPLFGDTLPAEGLGNVYWLSNQSNYVNYAGDAGYGAGDIDSAKANLEAAGYTLNGDGVYEHPENGVLSLRVGTTGGNRLREIQQELIQAQMSDAGIEITIDNVEGAAYFGERPFSGDALACSNSLGAEGNCDIWDITQFAWVGGPWPGGMSCCLRTGAGDNPYGYGNADFDVRADECDATIDDTDRAACYNELSQYVTTLNIDPNGLVMLPLTQKPSFYGFTSDLSSAGVAPDAQGAGPLTNVVDFVFAG